MQVTTPAIPEYSIYQTFVRVNRYHGRLDLSHVVRLNGDWATTEDSGDVASKVDVEGDVDPDVDGAARVPQFVCNALH